MTIIHLLNGKEIRGAEKFALQLAFELQKKGVMQRVIFLQTPGTIPQDLGSCAIELPPEGRGVFTQARWLRFALGRSPEDIVLCHGQGPLKAAVTALMFRRSRPKLVIKAIGFYAPWIKSFKRLRFALNRMLLSRADLCIAIGPGMEEELADSLHVPRARIVSIPNGRIPPDSTDNSTRSLDQIVMVGVLSDTKNVDLGLDVLKEVRRTHPHAILKFVGDGPLYPALKVRALSEFEEGAVCFAGRVVNVWPHLREAALLLLCSKTEGVPGVVIEAGMAGLPVVGWDVGDTSAVLRDGLNGRITPFGDVGALRESITELLGDHDERRRLGEEAERYSRSFAMDSVASSYINQFTRLEVQR